MLLTMNYSCLNQSLCSHPTRKPLGAWPEDRRVEGRPSVEVSVAARQRFPLPPEQVSLWLSLLVSELSEAGLRALSVPVWKLA